MWHQQFGSNFYHISDNKSSAVDNICVKKSDEQNCLKYKETNQWKIDPRKCESISKLVSFMYKRSTFFFHHKLKSCSQLIHVLEEVWWFNILSLWLPNWQHYNWGLILFFWRFWKPLAKSKIFLLKIVSCLFYYWSLLLQDPY